MLFFFLVLNASDFMPLPCSHSHDIGMFSHGIRALYTVIVEEHSASLSHQLLHVHLLPSYIIELYSLGFVLVELCSTWYTLNFA